MEARHARIKEMKAQRLERAAAKQREIPRQAPQTLVEIPDIDAEIKSHRTKIAQTLKAKNEEIEERERHSIKVRKIEQSLLERSMPKEKQSQTRFKANSHDESLKIRLQLLFKNQILRIERHTFNIWSSKCRFQSKAFERAKCFSDFRTKSLYFSLWKKRLRQIQNQKELDLLEFNLRRKKALEETSYSMYIEKALRKAFTKWRSRYRASIAQKIVEEQHSKRRLFFEGKITENKRSTSSATPKPPKASPKTAAKRKIKQITVDPKIEEMTKRMEETKLRRIEKAQKDAEIAQKQEEEKLKKN